ncbi:MAG: diacylglyceryl transferase [Flavobacteriaceae bacterium]|nr:diacylglyceryl transferase [Flavobacteriaceae bacterium]MBT6127904.1 diacylglyceryl transferase [Flavobacteriaceae bacterium]MDG1028658.1 diacylglyceryl transferase [Flavobacteriaceae bacterium]MDG1941313.1 diacylglyceryl transferase [Flavobacteriaceae bacterium]
MKYLKKKWGISSNTQLAVIFIVFAITGSASAKLAAPLLEFLGVQPSDFVEVPMGMVFYTLLRVLIIFPIYQILLIIVATLFFQFKFFWEFEKKILKRMGLKFLFEKKNKI